MRNACVAEATCTSGTNTKNLDGKVCSAGSVYVAEATCTNHTGVLPSVSDLLKEALSQPLC